MKIKGIEGMSIQQVQEEINRGGKFVLFTYCFSIIVMTFKRPTDVYFIKADQNAFVKSLPWTATSFLFGWWGIPWGIIYTFSTLFNNIKGGKDVTPQIMQALHQDTGGQVFEFEAQTANA